MSDKKIVVEGVSKGFGALSVVDNVSMDVAVTTAVDRSVDPVSDKNEI